MKQPIILNAVLIILSFDQVIHCTEFISMDEYKIRYNGYIHEIDRIYGVLDSISNDSLSQLMVMRNDELTIIGISVNNVAVDIQNKFDRCHLMGQLVCKAIMDQKLPIVQFISNLSIFHCFETEGTKIIEKIELERLLLKATEENLKQSEKNCRNETKNNYNKVKWCTPFIAIGRSIESSKNLVSQLDQSIKKNKYGDIKHRVRNCMLPITVNSTKSLADIKNKMEQCLITSKENLFKKPAGRTGHPIHNVNNIC